MNLKKNILITFLLFVTFISLISYNSQAKLRNVFTNVNHSKKSLTNTDYIKLLDDNLERNYVWIINDGENDLYIKFKNTDLCVNDSTGLLLYVGKSWTMDTDCIYCGEISAISVGGNSLVKYIEY